MTSSLVGFSGFTSMIFIFRLSLMVLFLMACDFCNVGVCNDFGRDSEIKKLKAENSKLKAENKALSKKPLKPGYDKCDRCLDEKPKPQDYAPNTTCRIDRTWRKVDEYIECYEWHSGRWWPVIVERWTWTDVKRCQTVTPR